MLPFWIISVILCLTKASEACHFPSFMHGSATHGGFRRWIARTEFKTNSTQWEKQFIVHINASYIEVWQHTKSTCGVENCITERLEYSGTCVGKDGYDKYRVRIVTDERAQYRCYKFREINENVALAWVSAYSSENGPVMCMDNMIVRDEWIWVAPHMNEWVQCPHPGGYDFKAYLLDSAGVTKEKRICPDEWRPSRLESECVMGEGMQFMFNSPECNLFQDRNDMVKQLYCWAYFVIDDHAFTLLGEANQPAHYVLKEPVKSHELKKAWLYYQPIAIDIETGLSREGFRVPTVRLKISRSEAGLCYDENPELCPQYSEQGQCNILQDYGNYCKKSCGLCERNRSNISECRFPHLEGEDMTGSWIYFRGKGLSQHVTVELGSIVFSTFGEYICKGIHFKNDWYKVYSQYNNGCRSKFTCLELSHAKEDLIGFRMSKSSLVDESFDLCDFESGAPPIFEQIESNTKTILLPVSNTRQDQCGVYGTIDVALIQRGHSRKCTGTLSDWNHQGDRVDKYLKLELNGQCGGHSGHSGLYKEFTCVAYVTISEGYAMLYTQELANDNEFTCWVIMQYSEHMSERLWREAYQLNETLCDVTTAFPIASIDTAKIAIETTDKGVPRKRESESGGGSYKPDKNDNWSGPTRVIVGTQDRTPGSVATNTFDHTAISLIHVLSVVITCMILFNCQLLDTIGSR